MADLKISELTPVSQITETQWTEVYDESNPTGDLRQSNGQFKTWLENYFPLKAGTGLTSVNEITVATITPSLVTYLRDGVPFSITATPQTLEAKPTADLRYDLIVITASNTIAVKTGVVSDFPTPPELLTDEILIRQITVDSTGAVVEAVEAVVYMAKNGNDANDGLSVEKAVKTFAQAFTICAAKSINVIRIIDNNNYSISTLPAKSSDFYIDAPNSRIALSGTSVDIPSNYKIRCYWMNGTGTSTGSNIHLDIKKLKNLTLTNATVTLSGNTEFSGNLTLAGTTNFICDSVKVIGSLTVANTCVVVGNLKSRQYTNNMVVSGTDFNLTTIAGVQIAKTNNTTGSVAFGAGAGVVSPVSSLFANGSFGGLSRTYTSGNNTLGDNSTIFIDIATNTTQTLPAVATCLDRMYLIKNLNATGIATIKGNGSELVHNANTFPLNFGDTILIHNDGGRWRLLYRWNFTTVYLDNYAKITGSSGLITFTVL
jgi:hypothetical protein